jgi:hypothetical protein
VPASPESALPKVKALVNGAPVTAEELALVRAEPARLRQLVDGWSMQPAFPPRLQRFLGTALQQDSVGALRTTLGFPQSHFEPSRQLKQALENSFVTSRSPRPSPH